MIVFCILFLSVFPILCSLSMLLVISSLDIPLLHNVSTTSSFSLFKFLFSSLHNLLRTMQDLLDYISNSSVFAVSYSWRTDVTWLADASPPSSAMTHSSNLIICTSSLSIVFCCSWITTSKAAWFPLSIISAAFPTSLIVA